MTEFLDYIFGPDIQAALLVVLNLIIIESLLSVDNAAVLATVVMDLPAHQRSCQHLFLQLARAEKIIFRIVGD